MNDSIMKEYAKSYVHSINLNELRHGLYFRFVWYKS